MLHVSGRSNGFGIKTNRPLEGYSMPAETCWPSGYFIQLLLVWAWGSLSKWQYTTEGESADRVSATG